MQIKRTINEMLNISNTELSEWVNQQVNVEVDQQYINPAHSDTIIREILMGAQELESNMRALIKAKKINFKGNLNKKCSGDLISLIEKTNMYSNSQIKNLRFIISSRNWIVHGIFENEKTYSTSSSQPYSWLDYYRFRLAVTKYLIYETIDLFSGARTLLSN